MEKNIVVSGKRKRSVARATIKPGKGKVTINKQPYQLLSLMKKLMISEPIEIAKEKLGSFNYDIEVTVKGGGVNSQAEASRLAIARGLVKATGSIELKKAYVAYDRNLLVADVRRSLQARRF
jgi:small subunit ribosomal protein S9